MIWERGFAGYGVIPVIIPLVVYHGRKNWNIKHELKDLVVDYGDLSEDIRGLIPNYRYLLFDFSSFSDEEIKGEVRLRIAIKIMRDIQKRG